MHSSFYFSTFMKNFLFNGVNIDSSSNMVSVCLGLACLAILLEGLKAGRHIYLHDKLSMGKKEQLSKKTTLQIVPSNSVTQKSALCCCQEKNKRTMYLFFGALQYMVTIILNYILMLSVMTFNAYFIIAAVSGATLGYLCFGFLIPLSFPFSTTFSIDNENICTTQNSNGENAERSHEGDSLLRAEVSSYGATGETLNADISQKNNLYAYEAPKSSLSSNYYSGARNRPYDDMNSSNANATCSNILKVEAQIHATLGGESL